MTGIGNASGVDNIAVPPTSIKSKAPGINTLTAKEEAALGTGLGGPKSSNLEKMLVPTDGLFNGTNQKRIEQLNKSDEKIEVELKKRDAQEALEKSLEKAMKSEQPDYKA